MTIWQIYLFTCLYLVILAVVIVLTRATTRRIVGALVGAGVAGVFPTVSNSGVFPLGFTTRTS
jgi:hypothetical protein